MDNKKRFFRELLVVASIVVIIFGFISISELQISYNIALVFIVGAILLDLDLKEKKTLWVHIIQFFEMVFMAMNI